MHLNQLVFQVLFGGVLMFFGLVPGLFQRFMEAVPSVNWRACHSIQQPTWLAGAGALVITVSSLIFLSN